MACQCVCDTCTFNAALAPFCEAVDKQRHEDVALRADNIPSSAAIADVIYGLQYFGPSFLKPLDYCAFLLTGKYSRLPDISETNEWTAIKSIGEGGSPHYPTRVNYIVGCGRSGTTAAFKAINTLMIKGGSTGPMLALDEPRQLWNSVAERFDVTSVKANERDGQLRFGLPSQLLIRAVAMYCELLKSSCTDSECCPDLDADEAPYCHVTPHGAGVILEKFPDHTFRLDLLLQLWNMQELFHPFIGARNPSLKFINLIRNGIDVARSIAVIEQKGYGAWFGVRGQTKWKLLRAMAKEETAGGKWIPIKENVLQQCDKCPFGKGLIEWGLSVDSVLAAKHKWGDKLNLKNVRYEELVTDARSTVESIGCFLAMNQTKEAMEMASRVITPVRIPGERHLKVSEEEEAILVALNSSAVSLFLLEFGYFPW